MKNGGRWLGIGLCILLLIAAFSPSPEPKPTLGLTAEQRQEDFLYLHATLERLYPYWGELEGLGVDMDALEEQTEQQLAKANSDLQFFKILNNYLQQLQSRERVGHLTIFGEEYYNTLDLYTQSEGYAPWAKQVTQPRTVETYAILYPKAAEAASHLEERSIDRHMQIETRMMRDGIVAYLRIPTFENQVMAEEGPKSAAFIQSAVEQGCGDLIIDIRGNGGGNVSFWIQYIVMPNLTEDVSVSSLFLIKEGALEDELLQPYFSSVPEFDTTRLNPIQELPCYDSLSLAAQAFPYYIKSDVWYRTEHPQHPFTGRIWLLCDQNNASASEGLVEFCQQTGFATVIGSQTNGDRCSIDPVLFTLPNSGLVVRFDPLYALNSDGSCNAIAGARPEVETGERNALNVCLELIEAAIL